MSSYREADHIWKLLHRRAEMQQTLEMLQT